MVSLFLLLLLWASILWVNYGGGHTPKGESIQSYRGFSWTNMQKRYDNDDAREKFTFVDKKYNLEPNSWYHIAISLSYDLAKKIYVNGELIGSGREQGTRSDIFNDTFDLNISRYVKFGSTFDAYLDEVRVYDNDLSDEDVKKTLSHLTDPNTEASKGLLAYFDFEQDINGHIFTSNVGGKSVNAEITSIAFLGENNSKWTPVSGVQFGPSTALVEGNSYKVETNATWSANKAQFSDAQNTETSGSIIATWKKNGVYPVTLKLENAWGIDTKTYNVVNVVDEKTAIDEVSVVDLSVYPNPFTDHLRLHFANDGIYSLYLYDLNAQLVDIKTIDAIADELYTMDINAANGYYVLSVVKDGKQISTIKLQKK